MGAVYLVRHGQAPAHAYGVGTAAPGAPGLTDLGFAQARRSGDVLAGLVPGFDAAISGDLPRQVATAQSVLGAFDTAPDQIVDAAWNEYALPPSVTTVDASLYDDRARYQQALDVALAGWIDGDAVDDGESYTEFATRTRAAAERAATLAGSGKNVLVVSSAGTITQLLAQLWGVPGSQWPTLHRTFVNASITKLIAGRRGLSVVSFNEHAHLAGAKDGLMTYR
ncbi:histidine phosphatase family protein [Gordonia liuliyuniae]|uniref:Histidine phosphatase family protein n=1 Tax=Gordonia liuliyuniae TaxID=2911517 RepID=A0ABS9IPC8_9ACTN|nr:histidine phosphatase family protein [Gordonia liuliyuniae]MCF8587392.1 histidine phosphatase family protein [Gordonia liuliyuniae]